jgi:hypothetical protein
MSRMSGLLKTAAGALEQGDDPLHVSFLIEHEVTLDECYDLADHLASGARIMAWVSENPRAAAKFAEAGSAGVAMDAITEALRRINVKTGG